ncbi:hypothetical protein GCM10010530_33020 [Kribbella aluminosa]
MLEVHPPAVPALAARVLEVHSPAVRLLAARVLEVHSPAVRLLVGWLLEVHPHAAPVLPTRELEVRLSAVLVGWGLGLVGLLWCWGWGLSRRGLRGGCLLCWWLRTTGTGGLML